MSWKWILLLMVVVVGGAGYYLINQTPPPPKDATLDGYAHSLQNDEAKARAAAATANIQTVQDAVGKYRSMKGSNPASLQDLVPEYLDHVPGGLQYDASTGTVSVAQ
jgi:hypothetical protein